MEKTRIRAIAISGEAGSGKTTLAKEMGRTLSWEVFGAGELFREWCGEHGFDDIGAESGSNEVHNGIDELMRQKMVLGESVVEGRVAGLVAMANELPAVVKVLLVCQAEERYRRIYMRDIDKYESVKEVKQITNEREGENLNVFSKRYGRSYLDKQGYDLVIDTGENNLEKTVKLVTKAIIG